MDTYYTAGVENVGNCMTSRETNNKANLLVNGLLHYAGMTAVTESPSVIDEPATKTSVFISQLLHLFLHLDRERSIDRACLFVCMSAHISQDTHIQSIPNSHYMLPVAVAQSCSGGVATCYVYAVLWPTSCLPMSSEAKAMKVGRLLILTHQGQHGTAGGTLSAVTTLFDIIVGY